MAKDYKDTLNLPSTGFPMKANLTQREPEFLAFWEENNIYEKMLSTNKGNDSYVLHDGPPYANGNIHIGHALNKILKDIIVKYRTMKGMYSPYIPGWDCHGLPIELQVDKKLGKKKHEIDILEKRTLCREYAQKFVDIQRDEFKRLGVLGDWPDPYLTMTFDYEATILKEFYRFLEKGYVYRGRKPVHWCPSCVTALAEAEVEYADKESPSIYVKFRVKDPKGKFKLNDRKGTYFVIWTTTPWTLPANMALAIHPDLFYAILDTPDGELIVVYKLVEDFANAVGYEEGDYKVIRRDLYGAEIEGIICTHPWIDREVKTILGDHVTLEQGTGVVHTAPGHGQEDYEMGLKYGLEVYAPVNDRGLFTKDVDDFAGQHVYKANMEIIERLKKENALVGSDKAIKHSYPHCWRCKKPVIFRATEQWFISVEEDDLRNKCLKEIDKVHWIPSWGKDRIIAMMKNRPDWCISRQRSWGIPIAVLICTECGEIVNDTAVLDETVAQFKLNSSDIWFKIKPEDLLPNDYKCGKCGNKEFKKEMDILDVWFDSGVSHAAVVESNEKLYWPADMYLEGSDQHRGWFQSSLIAATGTRGQAPFKTVLTHGFVVDGSGKKMSKSVGNVVAPQDVIKRSGAEILRLWVSAEDYRDDVRISNEIIQRLTEAYRKIRNTCRFLLGNINDLDEGDHSDSLLEIDRWAMSRTQNLIKNVSAAYESCDFHEVFHRLYNFCIVDLSNFYLDIIKDRIYTFAKGSPERRAAQWTMKQILLAITKLMAPVLSFTAEEVWRFIENSKEESVFISMFPVTDDTYLDDGLEIKWENIIKVRNIVNKALELKRQEKFIGNALEAKVVIYCTNDEIYRLLSSYDNFLNTLFIVSQTDLVNAEVPEDERKNAVEDEEIKDLNILVQKADGEKCGRCWNFSTKVGTFSDDPAICERCHHTLST
jgi:isoleucyl-tRNA synthetase